jgi:polysaccharide biosynthesis/export protein
MTTKTITAVAAAVLLLGLLAGHAAGQTQGQSPTGAKPQSPSLGKGQPQKALPGQVVADPRAIVASTPPPPPGYVIGADDVLTVLFWNDRDMNSEVTVRPDGMISLALLNDVQAAGFTPEQLRDRIAESAKRFIADPSVTVVVHEIKSRRAFITGQVAHPGAYPLVGTTTVLQLIALAGGLTEFADGANIMVMRNENGKAVARTFNYRDVTKRRNLQQNIELKPGDTVIVP